MPEQQYTEQDTDRDARVFALYEQLLEMEQRLIPTGLHVFGRASSAGEQTDLFKMIVSFERPELGIRALPQEVVSEAVQAFINGGVSAATELAQKYGLDEEIVKPSWVLLERVREKLQTNIEIDSLVRALRGEFIKP